MKMTKILATVCAWILCLAFAVSAGSDAVEIKPLGPEAGQNWFYNVIISNENGTSYSLSLDVPGAEDAGYGYVSYRVNAQTRDAYRYMVVDIADTSTGKVNIWTWWVVGPDSETGNTASVSYHSQATVDQYAGKTVIDFEAASSGNANDEYNVVVYPINTATGDRIDINAVYLTNNPDAVPDFGGEDKPAGAETAVAVAAAAVLSAGALLVVFRKK